MPHSTIKTEGTIQVRTRIRALPLTMQRSEAMAVIAAPKPAQLDGSLKPVKHQHKADMAMAATRVEVLPTMRSLMFRPELIDK